MSEKKVEFVLQLNSKQAVSELNKTKTATDQLDQSFDNLQKELEEVANTKANLGQQSAQMSSTISQGFKAAGVDAQKFADDVADSSKKTTEAWGADRGSIEDLDARIKDLVSTRNKINDPKIVAGINDRIKKLQEEKSALEGATEATEESSKWDDIKARGLALVNKAFSAVGIDISKYTTLTQASTSATTAMTGATKGLRVAMISTGIGAVVVVVGALIAAFMKLQPVMDRIEQGTAALGGGFAWLTDRVGAFLGMNEKSNASLSEAITQSARLKEQQQQLADTEIQAITVKERLRTQIEELRTATRDENITNEEKIKLLDEAIEAEKQLTDVETFLAEERFRIAKENADLAVNDREANRELAEAEADLIRVRADSARRQREIAEQRVTAIKMVRAEEKAATEQEIKDAEARAATERAYIDQLNMRLQSIRETLMTEEELRAQALQKDLADLQAIYAQKLLTEEEYQMLQLEIKQRYDEMNKEQDQARVGSIREVEEQIALLRTQFREASTEAERQRVQAEIDLLNEELKVRSQAAEKTVKIEKSKSELYKKYLQDSVAATLEAGLAQAKSVADAGRAVFDIILKEVRALVFKSVLAAVPFPANVILAPVASAAAGVTLKKIAGYRDGGLVSGLGSDRSDSINARLSNGEFVVNAQSTRAALPVLEQINASPTVAAQISQASVRLDDGGFFDKLAQVEFYISDRALVGKLNSANNTRRERIIERNPV